MCDDRTNAEQLAIVAALVSIIISRKLTVDEIGLVGEFLDVLGDMLEAMQSQIEYGRRKKEKLDKLRKMSKRVSKRSSKIPCKKSSDD